VADQPHRESGAFAVAAAAVPRHHRRRGASAMTDDTSSRPGNAFETPSGPMLLSGGNPQIAKGEGDGPVQAYIAAMPGWKSGVGRRLDALIEREVPGVRKAVKYNSPFYGAPDREGWFLSYHCFSRYVKLTIFRGAALSPAPPVASKHQEVRYFHIHEGDILDEALLGAWLRQASALPGEKM
jgi:hypothetical protein